MSTTAHLGEWAIGYDDEHEEHYVFSSRPAQMAALMFIKASIPEAFVGFSVDRDSDGNAIRVNATFPGTLLGMVATSLVEVRNASA